MQHQTLKAWVDSVRVAAWLSGRRAKVYCGLMAAVTLFLASVWIGLSRNGMDASGQPLGTDFLSFWSASRLALDGHAAEAYGRATHAAAQRAVFGGAQLGYFAFFYPPVFLLICWPLALLPYGAALVAWLAATGTAYALVIRRFFADDARPALAILAFPAVLWTIGHGQNAFLSTALFGGAVLALGKRPLLAGMLLGALVFKPQLGLLVPVFLIGTGAWAALAAACLTVAALGLASLLAFGPGCWTAFLAASPLARSALEQNQIGNEKMQSAFAAVRLWHGGLTLAYGVQIAVALLACGLLLRVLRAGRPDGQGVALVAASLLASPFLLDYDLTLLAVPLAWTFARARESGFLPWEKAVLGVAFVLPLVSRLCAAELGLPLGPPVILAVLMVVVRRSLHATAPAGPRSQAAAWTPPLGQPA